MNFEFKFKKGEFTVECVIDIFRSMNHKWKIMTIFSIKILLHIFIDHQLWLIEKLLIFQCVFLCFFKFCNVFLHFHQHSYIPKEFCITALDSIAMKMEIFSFLPYYYRKNFYFKKFRFRVVHFKWNFISLNGILRIISYRIVPSGKIYIE